MKSSSRILLGIGILILGLFFSHGLYQSYWLWTLPASALAILFAGPLPEKLNEKIERHLPSVFLMIAAVFVTRGFGQFGNLQSSEPDREWLVNGFRLLYFSGAVSAYLCLRHEKTARVLFSLSVLFVSLGLVLLLFASPRPWIDVWTVQESAAKALLNGQNPYALEYLNFYPRALQPLLNPFGNPFVYLPGVLYLFAPIMWIGLDTRIALVLAHAGATFLIGSISSKEKSNYFPALLLLSVPFVPYLIDQAWNDSFTVLFIALCAFSLHRKSFATFVTSLVGMSLIKQHIFLVMPLLIYFGSRFLGRNSLKTAAYWLSGFLVGCAPFAIWSWHAFIGSLWGFHALTHRAGPLIPDRQDGFSLLNWLTLNTGFRPYSVFVLVGVAMLAYALTVKRKVMKVSGLFAFSSVTLLVVFATAPLAFINYYWVCVGLLICSMTFESETLVFNSWPTDVMLFSVSRCLLLFSTQFFQSQTTFYNFFAAEKLTALVPLQAFGYRLMPFSQVPMAVAGSLKTLSTAPPLLSYRLYFLILLLVADSAFYFAIRKRCLRANLILYSVASALLFEQFYDHVELWAGLALAFGFIANGNRWQKSLCWSVAFAFQWVSGSIFALHELIARKRPEQILAVLVVVLGISLLSPIPLIQFFKRTISESNAASLANFVPMARDFFSAYSIAVPIAATMIFAAAYRKRNSPALILLAFIVFDPLAGTGALVLVLPCLALTANLEGRGKLFGALLVFTCALRTVEFHQILPAVGASQLALLLTFLVAISDSRSMQQEPFPNNPLRAL